MNTNQSGEDTTVVSTPVQEPVTSVEPVEPVASAAQSASAPVVPESATPVAPVATTPVEVLPEGTRDRTKSQFEKLIENNKRMSEEISSFKKDLAKRDEVERVFTPSVAPTAPQAPVNTADFIEIDPKTGEQYINGETLRKRLEEANNKAVRAEEIINNYITESQNKEAQRQNDEAFEVYPELDPNGKKYDPNFSKHVRGILQDSMWNAGEYGGRPLSFKAAADFIKAEIKPKEETPTAEEKKKADDKAAEAAATKEKISAQPATSGGGKARENMSEAEELEDLRYRTRYLNDDAALAERLKFTEHIAPKKTEQT